MGGAIVQEMGDLLGGGFGALRLSGSYRAKSYEESRGYDTSVLQERADDFLEPDLGLQAVAG